jgi:hypothetical protein
MHMNCAIGCCASSGLWRFAEGVLGDAYDRVEKAEDAARARVTADECRAFAERLHSL